MLADTSAWIEYLRGTGSTTHLALRDAFTRNGVHVTDAVRIEVLSGTFRGVRPDDVSALLNTATDLPQISGIDVDAAAALYRRCRERGFTIRSLNDCLIAAIAIRADVPMLHRDRDFDVIAANSDLKVVVA
jgi:predicted nucleic acid-binding protein